MTVKSDACPDWLHDVLPIEAHISNPSWQLKQIRVADEGYLKNCQ